jgi:hypothetical protein
MSTTTAGRVTGVTIPDQLGRAPEGVPDLTVLHMKELRMFGVQYTENGKMKAGMLVKDGDTFYLDPAGDQWVNRLRPLSDKLSKSAMAKFDQIVGVSAKDLPMDDSVDVVAMEMGGK